VLHLGVSPDGTFALCTGVGAELVEALGAHVLLLLLHVLLPVQVVPAVVAVEAISHGGAEITFVTCGNKTKSVRLRRLPSSRHDWVLPDGDSVAFSILLNSLNNASQWLRLFISRSQPHTAVQLREKRNKRIKEL